VKKTCQAKKKATPGRTHGGGETNQPEVGTDPGPRGTWSRRGETLSHRHGWVAQYQGGRVGCSQGSGLWITQHAWREPKAPSQNL